MSETISVGSPSTTPTAPDDTGHPRKWLILGAVSLGMFMALLDATIVNIAIPAVIQDLHATVAHVSWVLNAYNITLAVLFLSMGRLADRLGPKRVFIGGLIVFTVFSLLCGLAPNIGWLVVFRVGQAVGGAAMAPISLAILMTVFPPRQRGAAVGVWGALGTVAAAIGPTLGGILVTYFSWHWIFFVNVPIGVVAFAFALWVIPATGRRPSGEGIDVVGIGISSVGLLCLTLGLVEADGWGWASWRIILLFVIAGASYPAFVLWETRTRSPMFDFRLLRIRSFTAANTAMLCFGTAMGGAIFLLVIFMVTVLGYSELRAAVVLTAMPVAALLIAPNVGRLVDRVGPRVPATVGAACFSLGLFLLARLGPTATATDIVWRGVFLGVGLGFAMPTLSAASVSSLPERSRGVGSGALNMFRQVGFVLGVAILVSIFSFTVRDAVSQAARQSVALVQSQQQLPADVKAQIVAGIEKNAAAGQASLDPSMRTPPGPGGSSAPAGSQQAQEQQQLGRQISGIFKTHVANAFRWPYYAAAMAAALAMLPAFRTGRRLGEHAGYEELSRADRARAASNDHP
ncbi:MAG: DHA2 family efflux MFS transporter permease subunit [Actinobacteria bacterium]|nr:DHA2 family efflux MFS transporter permease subunit [Actinomycetota bacterium]